MEKIDITGVPETMLQTLYARAAYSQRSDRKFYDAKAIEIVSRMDYDFTKAGKDALMSNGVIARTILLDRMVGDFIRENPDGMVVNIACGLDMRCYRLDNGKIHWYNLDLPETIDIRRRFVQEDGRFSTIAKSAMDGSWADGIETNGKTLVVIEGLTMYLRESDVQKILSIIVAKFERVEIIMETMSPFVVKHVKEKSIDAAQAKFTWGVKSGEEVERLVPSLRWISDVSLAEAMVQIMPSYKLVAWIPAIRNISNKLTVLEGRT